MRCEHLGQSGIKIESNNLKILIDPYLSNSVQEIDSNDLTRKVPISYSPSQLNDIDFVLITHDHIDHCDPHTLPKIANASSKALFLGPYPVREKLRSWGVNNSRIIEITKNKINLCPQIAIQATPSAHPTLKYAKDGYPHSIGWFIQIEDFNIYSSGDTSLCEEILTFMKTLPKIDLGILPVNEDNFFRRRRGIIGNMSIREAFQMATELKIRKVFPVHWDMFEVNGALPEEINLIYDNYKWDFELIWDLLKL